MKWIARAALVVVALLVLTCAALIAVHWQSDKPLNELTERWAKHPSQFLDVNGQLVHLRDEGPKDDPVPIVLLHGTSASLHTWDGWTDALKTSRRVIRFDLPGFGLTGPSVNNTYTKEAYVQFVLSVLDQLQVERVVLAGNSLGGNIAWSIAAQEPHRVDKLILVDAAGYPYKPTSVPIAFKIARIPVLKHVMRNVLPRSVVESSVRNVYGDPDKVTEELVDRYYDLSARSGNRGALRERMSQLKVGDDVDMIATIKQPTLIIWGGQDRLIPPENGERFADDITDSTLVLLEELGHVPQEEDPAQTVATVVAFLETEESQ